MKIAILLPYLSGRGGIETVTDHVVHELTLRGNDVHIILLERSLNMDWLTNHRYFILKSGDKTNHNHKIISKILKLKSFIKLSALLNRLEPEIVLCVGGANVMMCRISSFFLHESIRIFSWEHFTLDKISNITKIALRSADYFLAISSGIYDQLVNLMHVPKSLVTLVYNGTPRPDRIIRPGHKCTFLYIGRLMVGGQKRVDDFLRALALLHGEWEALIFGDIDKCPELADISKTLQLTERIKWMGWQSNPWEYVNHASVLVLTSEYEGFGLVLIEALARGIPCISSRCQTGPEDIIEHGVNGYLYNTGNITQLAEYMQRIIDGSGVFDQGVVLRSFDKYEISNVVTRMENAFSHAIRAK